jgi:hypothetical protein
LFRLYSFASTGLAFSGASGKLDRENGMEIGPSEPQTVSQPRCTLVRPAGLRA